MKHGKGRWKKKSSHYVNDENISATKMSIINMTDIMNLTKSMDTENFNGNRGINIKETIIKMRDKDMEQWSGLMEVNMKVIGFTGFNMESV